MLDRYSRPKFRTLWNDAHRYAVWLKVELAVCRAMEGEKLVPAGTADRIAAATANRVDAKRILEIEEKTKHDVIAFLTHIEELAGDDARWLHLGMTSSDVLDTSFALLLIEAADEILAALRGYCAALATRIAEHRQTPMIGRSHGIHAEPVTFGLALAGFYAETARNTTRLEHAVAGLRYGKIAGAVGTYANISPTIEATALGALGLKPETVATQVVARDRHADFFNALALVGTGIERLALQVRHWQRTEVGEVEEAFGKGQKGSSAMPHKKNPILSENLAGLARLLRAYAGASLENVALWHERDISHSSVERVIAPDATALADFMLQRATSLVSGLVVHPATMMKNLEKSGGLIFSEAILLELVKTGLPRQRAYEHVQKAALESREGKASFLSLLKQDKEIDTRLGGRLEECFNLAHHLRFVDLMIDRALKEKPRD